MVKENSFEGSAFGSLHDIFDPYRTVACLGLSDLSISLWMGIYLSYSIGVIKIGRRYVIPVIRVGR
jgi:hypothetical protein